MPKIPEYEMQTGELETGAGNIPEIRGLDKAALAMQNLGENISSMGAHMLTRARQTEDTNAAFLYNEEVMKAAETANSTIDNDATPDGAGLTDTGVTAIATSNNEALSQIPARLKKEYAQKFNHLQRRNAIHLSNIENTKRTGYYTGKSEEYAGNRAITLREDPDSYEVLKKENEDDIDKMPVTPAVKQALKEKTNAMLLDGKADGDYKKDPEGLKKKLGATEEEIFGATAEAAPEDALRTKQLAFVWHELAGDPKLGKGAGSETVAYNRLSKATTLADAVRAGFQYERPKAWNVEARLRYARQVFTGEAPPAAMQARQFFESKGLSPIQASGLVGVLMGESTPNLKPKIVGDKGASSGVGQWNDSDAKEGKPGRLTNMLEFIKGDTSATIPSSTVTKSGRRANFQHGQYGQPGENIIDVQSASGIRFQVNKAAATDITGFVNDLEAAGAPMNRIGGYAHRQKVGAKGLSQHAYGTVIDVNQRGRNVVDPEFQNWANANPDKIRQIAAKHNMSSGGDWKNPDFGHWEWVPPDARASGSRGVGGTTKVSATVDSEYSTMSYEWRRARINKIESDQIAAKNDEYIAAATRTEQVAKDALASIQASGDISSIVEPKLSDFIMAKKGDEDKGIDAWMQYQTAKDAALLAYKFKGMDRWEIEDALEQYRIDIPTGEGAALGEQLYTGLQAAAKVAEGPKEAEEKLIEQMKAMWERAQKDVDIDRKNREIVDASIENSWLKMKLKWDEDEEIRATRKFVAAEAAAKSELSARQDHPWDYVMGGTPGDRNNAYQSVQAAWKVVSENPPNVPGYTSMTGYAIEATYQAQKHLRTDEANMQLVDPRYVESIMNTIRSDTEEVSMTQKMNKLAGAFSLTSDPHLRKILFNQFKKAGLPNEMRFALDAWERGDTNAYSMLFYPAIGKDLKPVDDIKLAKYKEEANKWVNSPLGQAEFGSGIMDPRSIENVSSASKLITNFSIMLGGDPADSAQMAFYMMTGPKHHVESTLGSGTKVNVSADNEIDDNKLANGFNNLTADVELAYISTLQDPSDGVARTRVKQGLASGSFVNYEDGYAFRTLSGRDLIDPKTGEVMKWTVKDVMAAADRKDNRVPANILKGFGLLPEDAIVPDSPQVDLSLIPPRKNQYIPDTADKFYKLYGGR